MVAVVVGDDVAVVVGVVTSQLRKPPVAHASVMALSVAAVAAQSELSNKRVPNAQSMVSSADVAGPRNSFSAAFSAVAVSPHPVLTDSISNPATLVLSHKMVPDAAGHAARTSFNTATCASQLCVAST